jgi:hypothetical protein
VVGTEVGTGAAFTTAAVVAVAGTASFDLPPCMVLGFEQKCCVKGANRFPRLLWLETSMYVVQQHHASRESPFL